MQPNDPKLVGRVADIGSKIIRGDLTVVEDVIDLLFELAPAAIWKPYLDKKTAEQVDKDVDKMEAEKFSGK